MNKADLRKLMKENLKECFDTSKNSLISSNLQNLLNNIKFQKKLNGLCVGGFSPIQHEPIWYENISHAYELALVHMHEDRRLSYHPCSWEKLVTGETSLQLNDQLLKEQITPDIILIPGLAFTESRQRLGRGAGYFDSFLEHFKGVSIGIFYECQRVENVFEEKHDQKLDYIITETRVY